MRKKVIITVVLVGMAVGSFCLGSSTEKERIDPNRYMDT